MNIIIAKGWAHRLLDNGTMESAKVMDKPSGLVIFTGEWAVHDNVQRDMTGGDDSHIIEELKFMSYIFKPEGYSLPHAEPLQPVEVQQLRVL